MHTWNQIEAAFYRYLNEPSLAAHALSMLELVERLRNHDRLAYLNRSLGLESDTLLETLVLWAPGETAMMHIDCIAPEAFELYMVHPGIYVSDPHAESTVTDVEHAITDMLRIFRSTYAH